MKLFSDKKKVVLSNSITAAYDASKNIIDALYDLKKLNLTLNHVEFRNLEIVSQNFQVKPDTTLDIVVKGQFLINSFNLVNFNLEFILRKKDDFNWHLDPNSFIKMRHSQRENYEGATQVETFYVDINKGIVLQSKS